MELDDLGSGGLVVEVAVRSLADIAAQLLQSVGFGENGVAERPRRVTAVRLVLAHFKDDFALGHARECSSRDNETPFYFGFNCGKRITSRMLSWPRSIMQRRSMPMPMPPAGGMPCSRATRKSSSSFCGSPQAWCSSVWRCAMGSFCSV